MDGAAKLWEMEQIKQLKARYFRLMDTKRWKEWRELFTDDFTYWSDQQSREPTDLAPAETSADGFVAKVSGLLETAVTVHHGHMPEIELTGERSAQGKWAMYDWVEDPGKGLNFEGFGHYHETYEKGTDGMWRIKTMRLTRLRSTNQASPPPLVAEQA